MYVNDTGSSSLIAFVMCGIKGKQFNDGVCRAEVAIWYNIGSQRYEELLCLGVNDFSGAIITKTAKIRDFSICLHFIRNTFDKNVGELEQFPRHIKYQQNVCTLRECTG